MTQLLAKQLRMQHMMRVRRQYANINTTLGDQGN